MLCLFSEFLFVYSLFFFLFYFFFFNDTATTEIYTLSLHDALPIGRRQRSLPVLHDQAEVARLVGRLRSPGGKCDELVADVDEGHVPAPPPQRELEDVPV